MTPMKWTNDLLDPLRKAGDPPADAAIEEIYALGRQEQVREALLALDRNNLSVPAGLPPKLREFFEHGAVLPSWADPQLITRGQGLLGRYQGHIGSTLLCASLPLCYGCADGAQVLARSTRLTQGVYRRLMETSQFVVDVLDTGSLEEGAHGVRSAQKIRLLHATMRYHLSRKDDWDTSWGLPVNQEDLAGTLMSFSVTIPQGLARLGVELPARDRDAFFHLWRIIGHILGVDEQTNPTTFEDGHALMNAILARQQKPSEAGTSLTKGVLDFIREVLPGPLLTGVGPSLIRHLIGDRAADIVSVPAADLTQLAFTAQSPLSLGYGKAGDAVPLLAKASNELGLALYKQGLLLTNKGRRYQWQVPTGLTPTAH
ncbi:oxygenase MpaB family protein [Streptomyces sp. L2]|uniref:oxygenase MpaB family protein n=1 Tax=Streptomyces sp. L2 TaxID=2162665 RepID=UPI001011FFDD|nr:oxygenase MpaB family protein [Streptomyces sp. L2]